MFSTDDTFRTHHHSPSGSGIPEPKLSVCIQAGGQSRRMGQNKALMPFMGNPLIQWVVERVRSIADELIIISDDPYAYEFLEIPILPDRIAGRGVLGGLYTSLSASTHAYVAPVACDTPFVNTLILQIALDILHNGNADVVIPESPNGLEPLHAVYRRETCLPFVQEALLQDQRRLISWFDRVKIQILTQNEIAPLDPANRAFININTPEDFTWAESLARDGF